MGWSPYRRQLDADAQGVSVGHDALGCVGALPKKVVQATELIGGKIQL